MRIFVAIAVVGALIAPVTGADDPKYQAFLEKSLKPAADKAASLLDGTTDEMNGFLKHVTLLREVGLHIVACYERGRHDDHRHPLNAEALYAQYADTFLTGLPVPRLPESDIVLVRNYYTVVANAPGTYIANISGIAGESQEQEHVWIDDQLPRGALRNKTVATAWHFVPKSHHPVFSGEVSTLLGAEMMQCFFVVAEQPLRIEEGDSLFAYVFLEPADSPRAIMVQYNAESWEHRAYWGEDAIPAGEAGTASRKPMGNLPEEGEWARIEVSPGDIGLALGAKIAGLAFTKAAGIAYWDRAGVKRRDGREEVWVDDELPKGATPTLHGNPREWFVDKATVSPFSGQRMIHQQGTGFQQDFFGEAQERLAVRKASRLFCYVNIDPSDTPTAFMLQLRTKDWEHRAYWGAEVFKLGKEGTASRFRAGDLPPTGQWCRIELDLAEIGLDEGTMVNGLALTHMGGRLSWDKIGLVWDPLAEVVELCALIPFMHCPDREWTKEETRKLPVWLQAERYRKQLEQFAFAVNRPWTAHQLSQGTDPKAGSTEEPFPQYLMRNGERLIRSGSHHVGLAHMRSAIAELDGKGDPIATSDLSFRFAQTLHTLGYPRLAAIEAGRSLQIAPDHAQHAQRTLTYLKYLYEAKQYADVVATAREYLNRPSGHHYEAECLFVSWASFRQLGKQDEAQKAQQELITRYPDSPLIAEVYMDMASRSLLDHNVEEASRLLEILDTRYRSEVVTPRLADLKQRLRQLRVDSVSR